MSNIVIVQEAGKVVVVQQPATPQVVIIEPSKGNPGVGVPTGGTTGQALVKSSNTDFATTWETVGGGPFTYEDVGNLTLITRNSDGKQLYLGPFE